MWSVMPDSEQLIVPYEYCSSSRLYGPDTTITYISNRVGESGEIRVKDLLLYELDVTVLTFQGR